MKEVDLESCSEITDITPLEGYSGLDYLNLEKITAPDWMRAGILWNGLLTGKRREQNPG